MERESEAQSVGSVRRRRNAWQYTNTPCTIQGTHPAVARTGSLLQLLLSVSLILYLLRISISISIYIYIYLYLYNVQSIYTTYHIQSRVLVHTPRRNKWKKKIKPAWWVHDASQTLGSRAQAPPVDPMEIASHQSQHSGCLFLGRCGSRSPAALSPRRGISHTTIIPAANQRCSGGSG